MLRHVMKPIQLLSHDIKVLLFTGFSLSMKICWAKADVWQQFWAAKQSLYFPLTFFLVSGWRPKNTSVVFYFFFCGWERVVLGW